MFPLFLNLMGRRVVVIGGGPVGRRKARAAWEAGAEVRVIDPRPCPADFPNDPHLLWVRELYDPNQLTGTALVFASATPTVNAQIVADAKARGIWVNSASDPEQGDVFVPATVRRGGLTVAIGTAGAAPALARRLREKLEAEFDAAFADWVKLLEEMRRVVRGTISNPAVRRSLLDGFAAWPWLEQVKTVGVDVVRMAMMKLVRQNENDE